MLAAQFNGNPEFFVKDIPAPRCEEGGILVKVDSCAICGTDLKVLRQQDVKIEGKKQRSMKLPIITGHELSGTVVQTGEKIKDISVGDRVVVFASIPCGHCHYCGLGYYEMCLNLSVVAYDFDGGFAQYMAVPKHVVDMDCVLKIPEDVSLENASLAEPMSCAINGLELSPPRKGGSMVVIGGGPIGNFLIEIGKIYGVKTAIMLEKMPEQLKLVSALGTSDHYLLNDGEANEKIYDLTEGLGADLVVTACSVPVVQRQAIDLVAKRGYVNFFGGLPRSNSVVELDTNLIHYKECAVVGTHGSCARHARSALELMRREIDASRYISDRVPLEKINEAFASAYRGNRLKIIIKPNI